MDVYHSSRACVTIIVACHVSIMNRLHACTCRRLQGQRAAGGLTPPPSPSPRPHQPHPLPRQPHPSALAPANLSRTSSQHARVSMELAAWVMEALARTRQGLMGQIGKM